MLIDTHVHYSKSNFDCGREEIIERLRDAGIKVIETAIGYESNEKVLRLCKANSDMMRAVLGCHPNCVGDMTEARWTELVNRIRNNQYVVAIGETGLDYSRAIKPEERMLQQLWLGRYIEISKMMNKPLVIHCRGECAYDDLYKVLLDHEMQDRADCPGVIHCFSGSEEDIYRFGELGFYFGVGGLFLKDEELMKSISSMPLERLLLETDSPYLLPTELAGKRNTSLNLPYIIGKLSEYLKIDVQRIIEVANKNAVTVFGEW